MKRYLNASEVAELADLLDEAPIRVGTVDEVLEAAAEGRGMTLNLTSVRPAQSKKERPDRRSSPSSPT